MDGKESLRQGECKGDEGVDIRSGRCSNGEGRFRVCDGEDGGEFWLDDRLEESIIDPLLELEGLGDA
jgi:hypothetical protein